ncbi:hypothetical protein [Bacillus velezensis]|uniref:hypothetical protein n=1 Tax=Bacillus velezensis TaxID=492670 RepID=UPI001A92ADA8|nr:hypothetical protein [Bacillus velezensis]BCT30370.1 hypothetical protein BVAD3_40440 [Bacillus velezensis]
MKCYTCEKEIEDGKKYISSNYGDFCSDKCWIELAYGIVGYEVEIRNVSKEMSESEKLKNKKSEPQWGDDLYKSGREG